MKKKCSILLVCAGGNSTSILVQSMRKDLREDENWYIDAEGVSQVRDLIGKYDYILVAPQMKFALQDIRVLAEPFGDIQVLEIPADIYASCSGSAVNDMVRRLQDPGSKDNERGKTMSENTSKSNKIMDKISDWMNEKLVLVANKISNQRHLAAVRDGLTIMIPATIIGGFAILLAVPPIPAGVTEPTNILYAFLLAWQSWAGAHFGALITPYYLTIGIISIYAVCGVSYQLAKRYNMNGLNNMISALLVFLIISGGLDFSNGMIDSSRFGAGYMFAAMITGILVVEITRAFDTHNIKIKLPDTVPPNVAAPFNVLIALAFNVIVFTLVNSLLIKLTGGGIPDLVYTLIAPLMKATGSLPSILFLTFLSSLFWFFGIHGDNMMSAVTTPITTMALAANAEAVAAGQPLPYIYAGMMAAVFGGWIVGNNAMNLDLLIFGKSGRVKSLSRVAAIPAMFNIAEPYVFGLPEVLNMYYFIPAVICQILNLTSYYVLASMNLVGRFYISLPFTTPAPLNALLGTGGDIRCFLFSIVCILVNMVIFYPFLKAYDNSLLKEEEENAAKAE
ncbi:MAG: PTS transporter subunit EIIC [Solobacterium sp.]|nr:PTS transporter subunit EIIC [Solobacterium sp.]